MGVLNRQRCKSSRKQRSSKKREDNSSMLSPVNGSSSNYITNKSIDSLKQLVNNKEKPLSTPPPYYNLLLRYLINCLIAKLSFESKLIS